MNIQELVQFAIFVVALIAMAVRLEHRLTKVETKLDSVYHIVFDGQSEIGRHHK